MNSTFLMVIVALLIVLIVVVVYNMHQENQYRKKIRSQFGHSDQDVLMNIGTSSVRDGQSFGIDGVRHKSTATKEELLIEPVSLTQPENPISEQSPQSTDETQDAISQVALETIGESEREIQPEKLPEPVFELTSPVAQPKKESKTPILASKNSDDLSVQLEELARNDLSWFDKRFDFMAYVALADARELQAIPRLSMRQHFQIIGCTRDGRFQAAEPIPSVLYQAFVIGLQGISRNGLVAQDELQHFTAQVQLFAEKMGGRAQVDNINTFLQEAAPLDELCARVDQTIAIHLVSRTGVSGEQLHQSLEKHGFVLQNNGEFTYPSSNGDALYSIVALNGSEFTESLLASQIYKGFSMLFDVTRVPNGEQNFNGFMSLAVKLSDELALDLVDDQIQPLSTDWLKDVRSYVGVLQQEMQSVGIEPASVLAKRLFA